MTLKKAHSHVNFMDLATNRAAYRLADNHDQEVLGYMAGYAQASQHANANALNTSVNGTKAVINCGSNELLSSMQLHKGDFGNITTTLLAPTLFPLAARMPGATRCQLLLLHQQWLLLVWPRLLDQQQVDSQGRFGW